MESNAKLYQILAGEIRCIITECGTVYIRQPTLSVLFDSELIYIDALREAIFFGVMTDDELCGVLINRGLWNTGLQAEMDNIPKRIEDLKVEKYEAHIGFRNVDQIAQELESTRQRFAVLATQRNVFSAFSAESLAKLTRLTYILSQSSYTSDNILIDSTYITKLVGPYHDALLDEWEIRLLARSEIWRSYWSAGKTESSLFGKPAISMTDQQRQLIAWSRFYDNIHESPECPNSDVINDDDMLDGWLILTNRQREQDKRIAGIDDHQKLSKAQEVFYVGANPGGVGMSVEDAKRVEAMNSQTAKMKKQQRAQLVEKYGSVREENLPDVQRDIGNTLDKMFKEKIRGRT